jgi:hypothetical protein
MATSSTPDGRDWFGEIITPEDQEMVDAAVNEILITLNRCAMICGNVTDFIDARFPHV